MGLKRRGDRTYFYRSVRRGDRIVSRYVGRGVAAEAADAVVKYLRLSRDLERYDEVESREGEQESERAMDALLEQARDAAREALEAAGYHQHKRGEWRKRRMATNIENRTILQPRMMDCAVRSRLVTWAIGETEDKTREEFMAEIEGVRDELAGPDPTPIESMLAETAATCWFALRLFEWLHASLSLQGKGLTTKEVAVHQKRISAAHRRLMLSLKTLATVRKLAVPALQVNIDQRRLVIGGR